MEHSEPKKYSKRDLKQAQYAILKTPTESGRSLSHYDRDLELAPYEQLEGKRILDLGAGQGLRFARELKESGVNADVVSFSPAFALYNVRGHMASNEVTNLAVAGMAQELPFAAASFDRVVVHSLVEYLETEEHYHKFLSEVMRVLKPGGRADIAPLTSTHVLGGYPLEISTDEFRRIVHDDHVTVEWQTLHHENRMFRLRITKRS